MVANFIKVAVVASCATLATQVQAETWSLSADLSGASEIPSVETDAAGAMLAEYDTDTNMLTWSGNYDGLSGPATAGHFHGPADPSANAGVIVPLEDFGTDFKGAAKLTAAQAEQLQAGQWYINIHTDAHPKGEIRGQIQAAE